MDSPSEIPVLDPKLPFVTLNADVDPLAREVYQHNEKSIVHLILTTPNGSTFDGSGVLVKEGDNVVIVTNGHVAANARSIEFTNPAGESFAASLEKFDDANDLAVLKPDGVKIDPSRAVDIGDPSKLTPGQMLYAMGHPHEYDKPVLSQGPFEKLDTYAKVAPETTDLIGKLAADMYPGNPAYLKASQEWQNSPHIAAMVLTDHGNSGGALFDKNNKLVGLTESKDDARPGESISVSSDSVKALLASPIHKFQFHYDRQPLADQSPLATTAKGIGLAGLASSPLTQKIAGPLVGLYYGGQAISDLQMLSHDNLYASRAHYWEKFAADGAAFVGGMATLVPRFRLAGACIVAARLAVDTLTDFTESKPVLDKVERSDGSKGDPLFWAISHR